MSQPGAPPEWRIIDEEFAWTELNPPPVDRRGQHTVPFRIFLVHVKTGPGTRHGTDVTNHPLGFLRDNIPEMGIPPEGEDVRAQLLRVNAELPANAQWIRMLATVKNSPVHVTILHYKDQESYPDDPVPSA